MRRNASRCIKQVWDWSNLLFPWYPSMPFVNHSTPPRHGLFLCLDWVNEKFTCGVDLPLGGPMFSHAVCVCCFVLLCRVSRDREGRSKPELENLEPRTQDLGRFWKYVLFQAEPRKMMWRWDEIVTFVSSSSSICTKFPFVPSLFSPSFTETQVQVLGKFDPQLQSSWSLTSSRGTHREDRR